ncbi:coiled-coil domain-containing protein 114 isoform X2 [Silurus meridionalis]|uniref:coiled-coil domain-containing protein 114 isoform X2 n=1 Tax=Silurus meridionalis TaxID=175797 RepID=UPI001EEC0915|nr:coiled-coil domain-containing protein 114 isoform X2 [Silurus meridionalis]
MPRGRSAISVQSESSEVDVDAQETEMGKLQTQFRVMESNRQACSIQTQDRIRKQSLEIEKLRQEHEELQKNLRVSQSQSHRQADSTVTQQLQALLTRRDELDEQLEKEKLSQAELEREVQCVQKKMRELRKGDVRNSAKEKLQTCQIDKATRNLENKLDRALVCFNEHLAKNNQLREELEKLRLERVRFQELHNKLDMELQKIRHQIKNVIGLSTAAYDARVEAQTKMTMMKEKAVKDLEQHNTEMKELERLIAQEQQLKDFMTTKCNERTGLDDALSHSQELKEQRKTESEVAAETLREVFQQLQKVTNEDDLETIVTKFIQGEDRNFALFNYVNEQNNQAEALKQEIRQIKQEMEKFQEEGLLQEQDHETNLQQMEEQKRDTEAQALDFEGQAKEIIDILDQIKTGVSNLFNKIKCDRAAVDDLLGSSTGITDSNIMTYLSQVEQKTNELLTAQAFIASKDLDKDYDLNLAPQVLLGQSSQMQKQAPVVQTLVPGDDCDIEESDFLHEEDRPLTQEELRQRILKKEESMQAEKSKEPKSVKLSARSSL